MGRFGSALALAALATLFLTGGCERRDEPPDAASSSRPTTTVATSAAPPASAAAPPPEAAAALGDPARGKRWVAEFECNRCHDGTGLEPQALERHCVHCHEKIMSGRVSTAPATLAKWKKNVAHVRYAPSLEGTSRRFRAAWLADFLRDPYDLRPALAPTMPRLALSEQQAADITAYLTEGAPPHRPATFEGGSLAEGRRLYEAKACGRCHDFSGARAPGAVSKRGGPLDDTDEKAVRLAPDLRHARARFRPDALERWLRAPADLKKDTLMPNHGLAPPEARSLARYVMETPLEREMAEQPIRRPPPLERPVSYAEVRDQVLGKTCGHCHGNPDVALGDGGPGNTGGFGFPPRKLDLTRYGSIASGYVAADGERHSVFETLEDGTPRLVASLLARHDEIAGRPHADVRGMPLGLPPVPVEDIALVDAWVRQGRPR